MVLPKGFNSYLDCCNNKLESLVLPEGFNSPLYCYNNNLKALVLLEGFNKYINAGDAIVYTFIGKK